MQNGLGINTLHSNDGKRSELSKRSVNNVRFFFKHLKDPGLSQFAYHLASKLKSSLCSFEYVKHNFFSMSAKSKSRPSSIKLPLSLLKIPSYAKAKLAQ